MNKINNWFQSKPALYITLIVTLAMIPFVYFTRDSEKLRTGEIVLMIFFGLFALLSVYRLVNYKDYKAS